MMRFVLCWMCIQRGTGMFRYAGEGDQIIITRDPRKCRYEEAWKFTMGDSWPSILEGVKQDHAKICLQCSQVPGSVTCSCSSWCGMDGCQVLANRERMRTRV